MANGKSAYMEGLYLDWRYALGPFASADAYKDVLSVTDHYMALFRGDPEDGGVEVAAGDYAREALGWGASNWTRTDNEVENDNVIDFGTAASDWAELGDEVTHVAVFDASTSGNMLESTQLDISRVILTGDPVSFAVGLYKHIED